MEDDAVPKFILRQCGSCGVSMPAELNGITLERCPACGVEFIGHVTIPHPCVMVEVPRKASIIRSLEEATGRCFHCGSAECRDGRCQSVEPEEP